MAKITMESGMGPIEVTLGHRMDGDAHVFSETYRDVDIESVLSYDTAFEAMGGDQSQISRFLESWCGDDRYTEVFFELLSPLNLVSLCGDFVIRALVMLKAFDGDTKGMADKKFAGVLSSILTGDPHADSYLRMLERDIDMLIRKGGRFDDDTYGRTEAGAISVLKTVQHFGVLSHSGVLKSMWIEEFINPGVEKLAGFSAKSVACYMSDIRGAKDRASAMKAERLWQKARFVKVLDAIQLGQGWPVLDEVEA
jgi:hypothetical protein